MLTIILNILLPPLSVYMNHGVGTTLLVSVILTLIGWLPGVIHAFIVNQKINCLKYKSPVDRLFLSWSQFPSLPGRHQKFELAFKLIFQTVFQFILLRIQFQAVAATSRRFPWPHLFRILPSTLKCHLPLQYLHRLR